MGIFSAYGQRENRVTSTILAVLQELSLSRIDVILSALLEEGEFELISFKNQPSKGHDGVPDASIISYTNILFETKITKGDVRKQQLERHLGSLDPASKDTDRNNAQQNTVPNHSYLIVLTPDMSRPEPIVELNNSAIKWASFQMLHNAIDTILEDTTAIVSERESFLLRELQSMLHNERLLYTASKDTLIIPAGSSSDELSAWRVYQATGVYACQPDRPFRQTDYIGFYADGKIQRTLAKIKFVEDNVLIQRDLPAHPPELREAVNRLLDAKSSLEDSYQKLFVLEAETSDHNFQLGSEVINDKQSESGKGTAFTQKQTYANSATLNKVKTTSEIDSIENATARKAA